MPTTMQAFPAAVAATATAATEALTPPDFDFQMPSCFFKSSFARSLSLSNRNCSGNGNGSNAFALEPQILMIKAIERQLEQEEDVEQGQVELEDTLPSPCLTPPPALPARRYTTSGNSGKNNNLTHFNTAPANQLQQQLQQKQPQRNLNRSIACALQDAAPNNNSNNNYHLPQQQTQAPQQQVGTPQPAHEHSLNVEAVILQNQVDTLQWQLKQSEKNCEMYRAVMEEVARFLERYQQQQQQQQSRQQQLQMNRLSLGGIGEISRSKSLHHVHGVQGDPNGYTESPTGMSATNSCSSSYLRARSSTNLMLNKSMLTMNEDHNYETIAPAGSYNAFKDFTWRRSPKKLGGCKARLSSPEAAEEKLNQEAFRLSRTIRNLLHTSQPQPDLTQPRHSMPGGGAGGVGAGGLPHHLHRLCMQKTSSVLTLHNPSSLNATLDASFNPLTSVKTGNNSNISTTTTPTSATPTTAEMLFLRANTMRDSRLSLRSSTDSSVHSTISSTASSTSSSKLETDEEIAAITTGNNNNKQSKAAVNNNSTNNNNNNGSSTEDESGFSSISSFHDVGLPMSSTLIADNQNSSRNSTLKSAGNVVGVPLPLPLPQQQQLSPNQSLSSQSSTQSPSKTYRNANRYQRFSTLSTEDAAAVLWV